MLNLLVYSILPAILLVCYGSLLAMWLQIYRKPDVQAERSALKLGWITLAIYAVWMGSLTVLQRQIPILTVGQVSAFLGLLIWADQLYVHQRIAQRLLVILPIAAVILLMLVSIGAGLKPTDPSEHMQTPWSAIHITVSLAGVAMLCGSGVFGAGSILLHKQLIARRFGRLFSSLPPMEDMHRLRAVAVYIGWLLITISLASSIVFMIIENSGTPVFFSHLHAMFALWLIITLLVLSERFKWVGDHRQARFAVTVSSLIFVLLMASVVEMFSGVRS